MSSDPTTDPSLASLIQAASELMPLLDQTILRLRYSQSVKGLSPLEHRILDYACYHGPLRVGDIAAMSGLSFPNASRYVKDLVAKGWLATERDGTDRRVQLVSPSAAGRELLDGIEAKIQAVAGSLLGQISPGQRRELEQLCRGMANALLPLARIMNQADEATDPVPRSPT